MRINKNISPKKSFPVAIVISVLLVVLISYSLAAYTLKLWPFHTETIQQTNTPAKSDSNTDTENTPEQGNNGQTPTAGNGESSNYIDPPLQNQPGNTDPYPIENEKYKISQTGEKSFAVTLFPIVNNPEYSDYNAQLKAYKSDVLTYLKNRYGSTANLSITWSPSDAQNL